MSRDVKGGTAPPRRTRREQARETRVRIMRAAEEVFAQRGYTGARMADIAEAAGVAVQTVYFAFHSKPELVEACYEYAVLGPEEVPPSGQAWYAEMLAARSARALVAAFAAGTAEVMGRAAVIDDVARAALHEPEIAAVREHSEVLRRDGYAEVLGVLQDRHGLREGLTLERATDIALMMAGPQMYLQLSHYGWTHEEYVAWLAATLEQQLLRPRSRR